MEPCRYRVVVRGRLSDRLGYGFEGVTLERGPGRTVLTGVGDRAQLETLLETLTDLHIELVSVDADC